MTEATNAARGRRQIKDTKIKRATLSLGDRKFFAPVDISSRSHSHIHAQDRSFGMTSQKLDFELCFCFAQELRLNKKLSLNKN